MYLEVVEGAVTQLELQELAVDQTASNLFQRHSLNNVENFEAQFLPLPLQKTHECGKATQQTPNLEQASLILGRELTYELETS